MTNRERTAAADAMRAIAADLERAASEGKKRAEAHADKMALTLSARNTFVDHFTAGWVADAATRAVALIRSTVDTYLTPAAERRTGQRMRR
jgi:hypothetical protein